MAKHPVTLIPGDGIGPDTLEGADAPSSAGPEVVVCCTAATAGSGPDTDRDEVSGLSMRGLCSLSRTLRLVSSCAFSSSARTIRSALRSR